MRWTVIIPARALPDAKSRLRPATSDADGHRHLVEAIRADTAAAANAADGVARVLVVSDRPGGPETFLQRRPGLNAALEEAAEHAARTWPADGVAALLGDLPGLRPAELAAVLAAAAAHPRSFVPDAGGTGSTLLAVRPGVPLLPAFGPGSAARHAASAVTLAAGAGLRHDVDTVDDLRAAAGLGLGPATSGVLASSQIDVRST